jgi:UDP-N-acetylmuramoylalanine--D-glutamate ligase
MARSLVTTFPLGWGGDWAGKHVLVLGAGDVGFAIADTLHELGAHTTVVTDTLDGDQEKILAVLGVNVVHDEGEDTVLPSSPDIVVLASPSMRTHPLAATAASEAAAVWSEVEFSYRVADKSGRRPRWILIAGHTHGLEIASLVRVMCDEAGLRAVVVGSLGVVALDALRDPTPWDVLLWPLGADELADLHHDTDPHRTPFMGVAVDADRLLGPEELDAVYFRNEHACVYSRGGGHTEKAVENAWVEEGCRAIGVGLDPPGMSDIGVVDDIVCDRAFLDDRQHRALELTTLAELSELGCSDPDSVGKVVTALTIARGLSVSPEVITTALRRAFSPPL